MRRIPPLGAIEAFVIASRARSFRAAAETLALSPSAFSRRIQLLETFVEMPLFDRSGPVPALTVEGERYLRDLEAAVDTIRRSTDALRANYKRAPLRVTASLSIATTWLLPRLKRFTDANPHMPIEVVTAGGIDGIRNGDADIALFGAVAAPVCGELEKLIDLQGVALASPDWIAQHGAIEDLSGLVAAPLLGTQRPARVWDLWLRNLGHDGGVPEPVSTYQTVVMTYEAASAGMGIALGAPLAAERFVREGRLVRCFAGTAAVGSSYYVAFADAATRERSDARLFAAWLGGEALQSQTDLAAMLGHNPLH